MQLAPMAFLAVCAFGVFIAIRGMLTLRVGTEPWWTGLALIALVVGGFAFVDGGWLCIQREVAFADGILVIRRWIEVLGGQAGHVYPLDGRTTASINLENVRSLYIRRDGVIVNRMTLGYWAPKRVRELIDALRANDVQLDAYWDGEYPPGTG
jgi:hypothetical protein